MKLYQIDKVALATYVLIKDNVQNEPKFIKHFKDMTV